MAEDEPEDYDSEEEATISMESMQIFVKSVSIKTIITHLFCFFRCRNSKNTFRAVLMSVMKMVRLNTMMKKKVERSTDSNQSNHLLLTSIHSKLFSRGFGVLGFWGFLTH